MKSLIAYGFGALLVLGAAGCSGPERDDAGEITEEATLDVFSIKVGDCFAEQAFGEIEDVAAVPCSEPHKYQAFAAFDLENDSMPASLAMSDLASEGCLEAFESFVGINYQESSLYFNWLEPTTESWAQGDREILCQLFLEDDDLTADAKGSGL